MLKRRKKKKLTKFILIRRKIEMKQLARTRAKYYKFRNNVIQ